MWLDWVKSSLQASSPVPSGGGAGKGRRACYYVSGNLTIYIEKVDVKCRLAEMTLVMTSLRLVRVFCVFVYIRAHFRFVLIGANLTAQSTGEPQGNWRWNSHSRVVVASSPPWRPPESPQARLKTTFQFFTFVWQIWLFLAFLVGVKVKRKLRPWRKPFNVFPLFHFLSSSPPHPLSRWLTDSTNRKHGIRKGKYFL